MSSINLHRITAAEIVWSNAIYLSGAHKPPFRPHFVNCLQDIYSAVDSQDVWATALDAGLYAKTSINQHKWTVFPGENIWFFVF